MPDLLVITLIMSVLVGLGAAAYVLVADTRQLRSTPADAERAGERAEPRP